MNGYIYLRDNAWCKTENVIKMGVTKSLKDRDGTYVAGEITRGEYISVITVPLDKLNLIDKCLKKYFRPANDYRGGGTEFYKRTIIDDLKEYIQKTNIEYNFLSKDEIASIERSRHIVGNIALICKNMVLKLHERGVNKDKDTGTGTNIEIKNYQKQVLDRVQEFYVGNNIGKIIWACGWNKKRY